MFCFWIPDHLKSAKSTELKYLMHVRFVYNSKSSPYRVCVFFVIGLFDKLKNYKFSGFSYFAKKVSGHGLCCVPFSESACNTENNDTKYAIEFRILSLRKTPWTTQSLNWRLTSRPGVLWDHIVKLPYLPCDPTARRINPICLILP